MCLRAVAGELVVMLLRVGVKVLDAWERWIEVDDTPREI